MTKPTKWLCPAKTQISLGQVWSIFTVRMMTLWVLSYPLSGQRRLWSDWAGCYIAVFVHTYPKSTCKSHVRHSATWRDNWASPCDKGTYHTGEQQRIRQAVHPCSLIRVFAVHTHGIHVYGTGGSFRQRALLDGCSCVLEGLMIAESQGPFSHEMAKLISSLYHIMGNFQGVKFFWNFAVDINQRNIFLFLTN